MALPLEQTHCPDCGTRFSDEPWSRGLCVPCLADLAVAAPSLHAEIAFDPAEPPTLRASVDGLAGGQILGERYRIRSLLGRGGMGEVWRAFDLKLRVDVALKALRGPLLETKGARELLRREVRSAREVVSPNVCRVFHIEEVDELSGRELVSMEYIDGETLTQLLRARSPLELGEAREIAAQFLAGLEAIHAAGLAHRDFKPENVMITRAGRVVVMDFGIAKDLAEGRQGTVSGTPAYMAPEQSRGESVDARADVFSAGVVLAEMIAPGGLASREARVAVTRGVHREPPVLADTPWRAVLEKAVARDRDARHGSASELARALEEVTLRVEGAEDRSPYPGLAAFAESDSEYFFGRELEVEEMWRKLRRPHLLALIGPSGAGKSSFLRAGLLPAMPEGWRAVIASPGSRPFMALGEALVDELSGDTEAIRELLRFEEPDVAVSLVSRWRQQHGNVLLILDQFEELFTQNPVEVQERFSDLLGSLALEADVHVLLAMRDDFLFHCHPYQSLKPILSELTLLGTLSGNGLRRALVQPALRCGYRFEDDALVDEMVAEVENERGALPMLAFAAARLWEHRDREQGLLPREAYEHIGGVGGALAQHAEATLETVGRDQWEIVRELLRNLVTAEGTRAARSREELLSLFSESPESAAAVLNALIDARLLTTYELAETDGEDTAQDRIEIIHESLLVHWPRLVRWQTQDAEGAQLRQELRQAARTWEQHDRSPDLLWTGTAYREFELWRERYPGALTALEESFAQHMVDHSQRRRRRRRVLAAAAFVGLLAIGSVMTALWRQSETARAEAVAETRRAEAAKLLALGQLEIDRFPTAAVAYALESLETSDTSEGRRFALEALQRGATVFEMAEIQGANANGLEAHRVDFSLDGAWLAVGGYQRARLHSAGGGEPRLLEAHTAANQMYVDVGFVPEGDVLVTSKEGEVRFWSIEEWKELRRSTLEDGQTKLFVRETGVFTLTTVGEEEVVRWRSLDGVETRVLGRMEPVYWGVADVDASGTWLVYRRTDRKNDLYLRSLADWDSPPRRVGRHPERVTRVAIHPRGDSVAAVGASGELRLWSLHPGSQESVRVLAGKALKGVQFGPRGRYLVSYGALEGVAAARLWDLEGPREAEPTLVRPQQSGFYVNDAAFTPEGGWIALGAVSAPSIWPLVAPHRRVLRGHTGAIFDLEFISDADLLTVAQDDTVRVWPLEAGRGASRVVLRGLGGSQVFPRVAMAPDGRRFALGGRGVPEVALVSLVGGQTVELAGFSSTTTVGPVAISPDGRLVAAAPMRGPASDKVIRIWDLDSGESRTLGPLEGAGGGFESSFSDLEFVASDRLLSLDRDALRRWNLGDGIEEVLGPGSPGGGVANLAFAKESGQLYYIPGRSALGDRELHRVDLASGQVTILSSHGAKVEHLALDPTERLVATTGRAGVVRVGPVSGESPHLLLSRSENHPLLDFSPDGRWLAMGYLDGSISLWPVPEGRPFHTLPYEELLERLRATTNFRVVADEEAPTGYKVEAGAFPGWKNLPRWWVDDDWPDSAEARAPTGDS